MPGPPALWINGPFGAGKTTLALELKACLAGSLLYDPEETGFFLRRIVPQPESGDFQDIPSWRRLVAATVIELNRAYDTPLIVPMTLVKPGYLNEIFDRLESAGVAVHHVFLDPGEEVLRARIEAQVLYPEDPERDAEVRRWRLEQIPRCLAFGSRLPAGAQRLDSGRATPGELARAAMRGCGLRATE